MATVSKIDHTILGIMASLSADATHEFGSVEQYCLRRAMEEAGMEEYPPEPENKNGERAFGDQICEKCGNEYYSHPMDWRVIGYGNVPFLNVLCNGERVKL